MSEMERGGLHFDVLISTTSAAPLNPTLLHWRSLIDAEFAFVKVQVMRDPAGHVDVMGRDRILQQRGFDPQRVRQHLDSGYAVRPEQPQNPHEC